MEEDIRMDIPPEEGPPEEGTLLQQLQMRLAQLEHLEQERLRREEQLAAAQQPRGSRTIVKLCNFSGEEDWVHWRTKVEHARMANEWTYQQTILAVCSALVGQAYGPVGDIGVPTPNPGQQLVEADYRNFMDQLEDRFLPEGASTLAHTQFNEAAMQPKETALTWHSRIRTLWQRAFPGSDPNVGMAQQIMVRRFIEGYRDSQIQLQLWRQNPRTMAAAIVVAQHETSVLANARRLRGIQEVGRTDLGSGEGINSIDSGSQKPSTSFPVNAGSRSRSNSSWPRPNGPSVNPDGATRSGQSRPGPKPFNGARLRCHICGDDRHLMAECRKISPEARDAIKRIRGQQRKAGSQRGVQEMTTADHPDRRDEPDFPSSLE